MKLQHYLFLLLSLVVFQSAWSQGEPVGTSSPDSLRSLVDRYIAFGRTYPQEKVYLHLDNSHYFLGETIWFKAYVVNAGRNSPSPLSKVLYAELVTPEGYIVETQKMRIEDGQSHGHFRLRDSLALYAGYYEVRAYTRYMLNFDDSFLFSRVFPVYDRVEEAGNYQQKMTPRVLDIPEKRIRRKPSKSPTLTFYPEGGNLVKGLPCRMAFKAIGLQGEDIDISGAIYDFRGDSVARLETIHNGMGSFSLLPDGGKYTPGRQRCPA